MRAAVVATILCFTAPTQAGDGATVPEAELPRTGLVADAPKGAIQIGIAADGAILTNGKEGGLLELRVALREIAANPKMQQADGSVRTDVVLRASASVPWPVVQWVMQTCAESRMYRLYFAVSPEQGGPEGVIDAFLPRDRGLLPKGREAVVETPTLRVSLFADEGTADRGAVFARLHAILAQHPEVAVEISTPPPNVPRAGHIVTILDLARRAGATRVTFTGSVLPVPARREKNIPFSAGALPWLRDWVAERNRSVAAGVQVKVGSSLVGGSPDGKPMPVPPAPPRGSFVMGASFADGVPAEVELSTGNAGPPPAEGPPDLPLSGGLGRGPGPFPRRTTRLAPPTVEVENVAVERGLRWLAANQSPDGGWEAAAFPTWCDGQKVEAPTLDGRGSPHHDVGTTGLALLAFLGAGTTNRSEGPYGPVVGKGLKYLRNVQDAEGCFGPRRNVHYLYDHGIAALAMVEAYAMTGSTIYKAPAQKALDFVAIARNPNLAWRYGVKPGDNDTSVTAWMFHALDAARRVNAADVAAGRPASLLLDEEAFDGVKAWIDKMTDPTTGRVGYQQRGTGPARPTGLTEKFPSERVEGLTGFGVSTRIALGEDPATSEAIRRGVALIAALPPSWETNGSIDFYSWHLCAIAMAQDGGEAGAAWRKALVTALLGHQRTDGETCGPMGSWDPIDPWGPDGGRVYSTSMALLALLAPYTWAPSAPKPK